MKTKNVVLLIAVIALTGLFAACQLEEVPVGEVTVTFDANGGTSSVSSVTLTKGNALGDKYPVPSRPGFVFWGWFEGVTEYTENMAINVSLTLTASWLAEDSDSDQLVHITFVPDNSTGGDVVTIKKGGVLGPRFPLPPRKQGYIFVNWTNASNVEFNRSTVVNNDTTVTANWVENDTIYTVTFAFRTGPRDPAMPGTPPAAIDVYEGDCIDEWVSRFPEPPTVPARPTEMTAYSFIGWADSGSEYYTGSKPITKDVTVYATLRLAVDPPVEAYLDLSEFYDDETQGWNSFTRPVVISYTNGTLTAIFDDANQAIVIRTPPDIRAAVRYGQEFTYDIDGEAEPGAKAYRAFIGNIGTTNNWNATESTGEVRFEELSKTVGPSGYVSTATNANYFVLMARNANTGWPEHTEDSPTTVTIRSIYIRIE